MSAETVPALPDWLDDFAPVGDSPVSTDPLRFDGYVAQLQRAAERTGATESVSWGEASIEGTRVVALLFEFAFMGGSIGEASGQRMVDAIRRAEDRGLPLVSVVRSGGARIQEGMRSLIQMQRVAAALLRLRLSGMPHISVLSHPTTGGVWASLGANADVIVAEEGATVAFAGPRVRGGEDGADPAAFSAQGKLAAGAVDRVVASAEVATALRQYIRVLGAPRPAHVSPCAPPAALDPPREATIGWEAVRAARAPGRARSWRYLERYFDELCELSGDRVSGRDPGMVCGIGLRDGQPIAFIVQTGVANRAAGFRTATRVVALAEAYGLSLLTLVDTPGAENDHRAETEGIGTAIAQTFMAVAAATVPITTLVVGEGGSGGALAIASPNNLWMTPDSYFSVIAPEGAAAILHRDPSGAAEVAERLRLAPRDLVELGIAKGIVTSNGAV